MTETEIRAKVAAAARKYLGCKEADGSHRQFIDRYNRQKHLPRNHKMTYTAAWCATFVSAIAIELGLTDIMPPETSCRLMIEQYRQRGRWRENEAYAPRVGDVIFYDWDDGVNYAATDNTGSPEHVGIVVGVSGDTISVIEGNNADAVRTQAVKVNGRYIRGYGLPDYASKATASAPSPAPKPVTKKCPYADPKTALRRGSKGNGVRWVQWDLNQADNAKLAVDGKFGPLTRAAVLAFQRKRKLEVDGIVGPKTRAALKKAVG